MSKFNVSYDETTQTLSISFGDEIATNPEIGAEMVEKFKALGLKGGKLLKINGPASLPVASGLTHEVCHLFGCVAVFDPKMSGYVVSVTHDPEYPRWSVIPA